MTKFLLTFKMALRDARANLMHTLLSVLGIVIGVAALVSILSLIDGLEKYAHEQIGKTTSIENIMINTQRSEHVDGMTIQKEEYAYLGYSEFTQLMDTVNPTALGYMFYKESGWLYEEDSTRKKAIGFSGIVNTQYEGIELVEGRYISEEDLKTNRPVALLSKSLADHLKQDHTLGSKVTYRDSSYTVIGVIDTKQSKAELLVPITLIGEDKIRKNPPMCIIRAQSVEEVPAIKSKIENWVSGHFPEKHKDIKITTNEGRVEQANQGFMVFRIVMGMIVGISVLVGGIGVMNVLLISVTERTAEIGVRKAVGAKRNDIISQFLSESIAISGIGSLLGILLGVGFTAIAVPIVKSVTEMPFQAAYTFNTLLVISIISVLVGVIFGTYPAMKAAKLDPVEAIRRE